MADPPPVEPFDATVAGVRNLLPHADIVDTLPTGRRGVTTGMVAAWLAELSGKVDLRLSGWRRLRAQQTIEEAAAGHDAPLARFMGAARDIVHNGAGSYTEAARFPERATSEESSYSGVLWQRYQDGLAELAAWLEEELTTPGGEVEPGPDVASASPAYSFPDAFPWSSVRF